MDNHNKLSDIGKDQPFRVPEGYFRNLPERIMERCEKQEQKRSFIQVLKPALSLAAMFIGVALLAYFAISVIDRPDDQAPFGQEDIAEAEYYDQYYNQNELLENLPEEESTRTNRNEKRTQKYIEYLLNEDIDYTTLINELKEEEQGDDREKK
jgi:hypothetical protein